MFYVYYFLRKLNRRKGIFFVIFLFPPSPPPIAFVWCGSIPAFSLLALFGVNDSKQQTWPVASCAVPCWFGAGISAAPVVQLRRKPCCPSHHAPLCQSRGGSPARARPGFGQAGPSPPGPGAVEQGWCSPAWVSRSWERKRRSGRSVLLTLALCEGLRTALTSCVCPSSSRFSEVRGALPTSLFSLPWVPLSLWLWV